MTETVTPAQAARYLEVSESTVRRWCDKGLLRSAKTAGGHRRIRIGDLHRFARGRGTTVASSSGATGSSGRLASVDDLEKRVIAVAIAGDGQGLERILVELLEQGLSMAKICDRVLSPAWKTIGMRWSTGDLAIYQEHQATECLRTTLGRVSRYLPAYSSDSAAALSCALSNDVFALAPQMVSLVCQDVGYRPISLGPDTPASSILRAVRELTPRLVAISVSSERVASTNGEAFSQIIACVRENGGYLALGGRGLSPSTRKELTADFFGDSMVHLEDFAKRVQPE